MSRRDMRQSDPISVIGYNGRGHIKYPLKGYDNEYFTITCEYKSCLLYTSPSPRDGLLSRMPSSA